MPTLNELLHAASRTFALGIDLLPGSLRDEVEVAYLLLRVSDYLEDNETMAPERKDELLRRWAGMLEGEVEPDDLVPALEAAREETPDALVARHVRDVHEGLLALDREPREVLVEHVADSTRGMARWALRGPDIADEAELDDYMHEVAGRVGWLLTDLFALHVPAVAEHRGEMRVLGREFGLALQTVNVVRGLHSDWERGWVFIPRSFVPEGHGPPTRLFEEARDPDVALRILDRLVAKAEGHLEAARRYISLIPRREHRIRLFCLLPLLFAVRTLAISRSNPRVWEEETKIGRPEVTRIVQKARTLGWSNRWIASYCRELAEA